MKHLSKTSVASLAVLCTLLGACSSDKGDSPAPAEARNYRLTVTNLSANQPLSPLGAVLHDGSHALWQTGHSASVALEHLAEGGNNQVWLDAARAAGFVSQSGAAAVAPGASASVDISSNRTGLHFLSVAGMLVNTNDAFSGVLSMDLSSLQAGESLMRSAPVYDAGSEANSERAETLPGPAGSGSGEGFNAARNDRLDAVRIHAGVIGVEDGLVDSALNAGHSFDNPAVRIHVTRY